MAKGLGIYFFEAHDVAGLDPNKFQGVNPFELRDGIEGRISSNLFYAQCVILIWWLCNTSPGWWSKAFGAITRFGRRLFGMQVFCRVFQVFLKLVPLEKRSFRLYWHHWSISGCKCHIGCHAFVAEELYSAAGWQSKAGKRRWPKLVTTIWMSPCLPQGWINQCSSIQKVAEEIDRCDLLLQPASHDMIDSRYASPLKSYDYMMRETNYRRRCSRSPWIISKRRKRFLYRVDPRHLADCITKLVNNPGQAEKIAQTGWKQSADYTYRRRAEKILSLV